MMHIQGSWATQFPTGLFSEHTEYDSLRLPRLTLAAIPKTHDFKMCGGKSIPALLAAASRLLLKLMGSLMHQK